jgi:hypothetical protein
MAWPPSLVASEHPSVAGVGAAVGLLASANESVARAMASKPGGSALAATASGQTVRQSRTT